jgi:hypothetical protein
VSLVKGFKLSNVDQKSEVARACDFLPHVYSYAPFVQLDAAKTETRKWWYGESLE